MKALKAEIHSTECCGLDMVGLSADPDIQKYIWDGVEMKKRSFSRGHAYFAVTTQKEKAEVKALKSAGFRAVGTWRNSKTKNQLTMWVKNMRKR